MAKKTIISALKQSLIAPLAEAFLASKAGAAWSPSRLGKVALNDANRIFQIRDGREVLPSTAQKIIDVIDAEAPGFSEKWVRDHARDNLYED